MRVTRNPQSAIRSPQFTLRNLLLTCATLLLAALLIYSFNSREPRADFTYVNPSGIHTLDPARMSWTQDFRVALNIWEGLTTWHPETTEPIEGAAQFPPRVSPDRLTYTFTIREEARWSNGDPVTAADFVRGWRRAMEPGTASDYAFLFADHVAGAAEYIRWRREAVRVLTALDRRGRGWTIDADRGLHKRSAGRGNSNTPDRHAQAFDTHAAELDARFAGVGITATDERTLEVRLARPCPYFLDLTAFPTFLPCHESIELLRQRHRGAPITAQGLVVYDPQWTKPDYHRDGYPGLVTNGPYRLIDWTFKRRARLGVNPHFRAADTIACRTIDMLVYENVSAAIMAYEAGDVDFLPAMDVPYDHEIARLARSGERPDFHLCVVLATYFLNFNCASATIGGQLNPFTDAKVRRAFALAVDKRAIVDNVLQRGDRIARSFVPAGSIPGYEPPSGLERNVDQARMILAEAGYPGGRGLPRIELLYTPSDERVCGGLARMWEDTLGVRVELRCKESKTFAQDKANHRYMLARGNWYADYNDPTTFLNCLITGNGNNDSGYANPRYDQLLARAGDAHDPAMRAGLLRQAERIIVEEDLPILPILHYAQPIAIKPHVQGLYPNARLWFPFRYVTIHR